MLTVILIIAIAAFVCTIINALGKCPAWIPLLLLCLIELLRALPLGR